MTHVNASFLATVAMVGMAIALGTTGAVTIHNKSHFRSTKVLQGKRERIINRKKWPEVKQILSYTTWFILNTFTVQGSSKRRKDDVENRALTPRVDTLGTERKREFVEYSVGMIGDKNDSQVCFWAVLLCHFVLDFGFCHTHGRPLPVQTSEREKNLIELQNMFYFLFCNFGKMIAVRSV